MKTIEKVLKFLHDRKSASGTEIAEHLGITRQAVNKHLKVLVQNGNIQKKGTTKAAIYFPSSSKLKNTQIKSFKKELNIKGLNEDEVFEQVNAVLNLQKNLRQNVFEILQYTFTEMVNNAIDHSNSDSCFIEVTIDSYNISVLIRDFGIGIFYSIFKKFGLNDEFEALGELLKGKTTTMSDRHSGEGIFFTSKALEISSFRSHKTKLIYDNLKNDVYVEQKKYIAGTEVKLQISRYSRKKLTTVFNQFAPEEYEYSFQRTKVHINLYLQNFISRSEARRLLTGLNKFKEIIFDFKDVKKIGQGFADEIFRVFKNKHPEIQLKSINLSSPIKQMISHVVDNNINN
jgi:anti-sigma regulatory factor (Ser/Thr protein kinase)